MKEPLGDEMFTSLEQYVNELTSQRDQARSESISGRKGLKEKLSNLESQNSEFMEKLGIDSFDDLDGLPSASGAAEDTKQLEAKNKRLERQLSEVTQRASDAEGVNRGLKQKSVIADAIGAHEFLARDIVSSHVSARLVWEGDDLLYKTDDGNIVSVNDGVSGLAKSRPELLKPTGTGGAGIRSSSTGGAGALTMTRAEFEALPPSKQMEYSKSGVALN